MGTIQGIFPMKKPTKPIICGREKINSMYWKYRSEHLTDKRMQQFLVQHTEFDLFSIINLMELIKKKKSEIAYSPFSTPDHFMKMVSSWSKRRDKLEAEYKEKLDEYERWLSTRPISEKSHRRKISSHSGK